jgi:hypothetical protein
LLLLLLLLPLLPQPRDGDVHATPGKSATPPAALPPAGLPRARCFASSPKSAGPATLNGRAARCANAEPALSATPPPMQLARGTLDSNGCGPGGARWEVGEAARLLARFARLPREGANAVRLLRPSVPPPAVGARKNALRLKPRATPRGGRRPAAAASKAQVELRALLAAGLEVPYQWLDGMDASFGAVSCSSSLRMCARCGQGES